jgi:hypothetical protein
LERIEICPLRRSKYQKENANQTSPRSTLDVDYVEKQASSLRQSVVTSGFVMMPISMFSFLTLETVAIETMIDIQFVHIITMKDIVAIGKSVKNVWRIL